MKSLISAMGALVCLGMLSMPPHAWAEDDDYSEQRRYIEDADDNTPLSEENKETRGFLLRQADKLIDGVGRGLKKAGDFSDFERGN